MTGVSEPTRAADEVACGPSAARISTEEFNALRALILTETGVSLGDNKHDMVCSRLGRRLRALGLDSYGAYYRYLHEQDAAGEERQHLINCITTNKTDFFREEHHFDFLREHVLIPLANRPAPVPRRLRLWSAGCSTGEEPYTLAITFLETCGSTAGWDVRILASDIDTDVLARAERGTYEAERVLGEVPVEILRRHFLRGTGERTGLVAVRPELRQLITFRRINLVDETWPIQSRFDAIFCRNVMIYFNRATQQRLLQRFAELLVPEGYLFLGHSENLHWLSDRFEPLGGTVYRLRQVVAPSATVRTTPALVPPSPSPPAAEERTVIVGDVVARRTPAILKTLLGSCVSACLFDPTAGVGGMNHFSLPGGSADEGVCTRYGVHAMELLINEVMKHGGDRRRLQAKVFGGARVLNVESDLLNIGQRNARFVLDFLETEGIPVVSKCLGGTSGLRVHFYPSTGKALVKPLDGRLLTDVAHDEDRYCRDILRTITVPATTAITLF